MIKNVMISRDIAKNEFTFELFQLTIIIILIIYIFKKKYFEKKTFEYC